MSKLLLAASIATLALLPLSANTTPISEPNWVTVHVSPDGSTLWSIRDLQVITPRDKFSYEFETRFAPNKDIKISHARMRVEASCKNLTTQVKSDALYGTSGEVLLTNSLVDEMPVVPKDGTITSLILKTICNAGPKTIEA